MFACEYFEIFNNTFSYRIPLPVDTGRKLNVQKSSEDVLESNKDQGTHRSYYILS